MQSILITAIGSMSAHYAIESLKRNKYKVFGCDIYPAEYHYVSRLCEEVFLSPLARDKEKYIAFLLDVVEENEISYILPLTDIEIDAIDESRELFSQKGINILTQQHSVLSIARDKYELHQLTKKLGIPSIDTMMVTEQAIDTWSKFPCVAKPRDGRSSEGLMFLNDEEELSGLKSKQNYILQEQLSGEVITVDYIRSEKDGENIFVMRRELLRTKNGAGTTVKIFRDEKLEKIVSLIGNHLKINGTVNLEFIDHNGSYYLIDINPRFSAGIAFTGLVGYDMVNNHVNCFIDRSIEKFDQIIEESILYKVYSEKK